MNIVIADASCLITLENIYETELLPQLYKRIVVTPEVADEVGPSLPQWIDQQSSTNHHLIDQLSSKLEIGEATSIALALEIDECILIIDEKKGRRTAKELGIAITGTFGVIMAALERDLISDRRTIVERLENAGFHISGDLVSRLRSKTE
jgi:uncharacterized protein